MLQIFFLKFLGQFLVFVREIFQKANVNNFMFLVLGEQFLKYMEAFTPYLAVGLKNHAEYQVSIIVDFKCVCMVYLL